MTDPGTDDRVPAEFWQELAKAARITYRRGDGPHERFHAANPGHPCDYMPPISPPRAFIDYRPKESA